MEYIGVMEVAKEALWLKDLALEMGLAQEVVRVHCNSQSTLLLAQNSVYHARIKHIDIRTELVEALRHQDGDCWVLCGALKSQEIKAKTKVQSPCGGHELFRASLGPRTKGYQPFGF
ncbi:uncharacterized protein [Elaeis guineensis]|uniref:uncharacterized protein n=1 Tax=Elaeis guineensis var. tenera TaxID=51953 RepID=UPI003C6CDDA9